MDSYRPISGIPLISPSPATPRFPGYVQEMHPSRRPRNQIPSSLAFWTVILTIAVMLALALAIEFALYFSNKHNGFSIGSFNTEQIQWLTGFLPVIAIGPLVWIWSRMDSDIKRLQPYVALSKGPARAQDSILLDLEHENLFKILPRSLQRGNALILGTSIIVLLNIFLPPLAASLFIVKEGLGMNSSIPIQSETKLGLNPSYKDVSAFVAAAGYAEAAAFYNLSDPPFVQGGWAVAQFKLPSGTTPNSTISVHTTAVYTNVSCVSANVGVQNPTEAAPLNWTLTASLPGAGPECTVTQILDGSVPGFHYGIDPMPDCPVPQESPLAKRALFINPVARGISWLAVIPKRPAPVGTTSNNSTSRTRDLHDSNGSAVICAPTVRAHSVEAIVDVTTGLPLQVNVIADADIENAEHSFDGFFFSSEQGFDLGDPSVKSRVLAVQSGLPGSVVSTVGVAEADALFGSPTGFSGLMETFYTRYLSMAARSIYFVPDNTSLKANITIQSLRLSIHSVSAHLFAALLLLDALFGTIIHFAHRRQRRHLYLASDPGSIAHYMGLLSHPRLKTSSDTDEARGFIATGLIGPLDDVGTMRKKLEGIWFMLERHSGVVVPVVPGESWTLRGGYRGSHRDGLSDSGYEMEDPRKSLLSPEQHAGE